MVENPFYDIEQTPTSQQPAGQHLSGAVNRVPVQQFPQHNNANKRYNQRYRMKDTVSEHVHAFGNIRSRRQLCRNHFMPLQNLVQDNAINKAAEPDA